MVSSQVLQKTIDELKAITRVNLAVLSLDGAVVASTSEELDGMGRACPGVCRIGGGQPDGAGFSLFQNI